MGDRDRNAQQFYKSQSTLYKLPPSQNYVSGTSAQQDLQDRINTLREEINLKGSTDVYGQIAAIESRKYLDDLINNYTIQWNYSEELKRIIDADTTLGDLKTALQEKVKQLQDEIVYSNHEQYQGIQLQLYKKRASKLDEQERIKKEMNKQYLVVNGVYGSALFPVRGQQVQEDPQQQGQQRQQGQQQQGQQNLR